MEWTVDDAVAQFGDRRMESTIGERIQVHESAATFLVLKGWAQLVESQGRPLRTAHFTGRRGKVQGGFCPLGRGESVGLRREKSKADASLPMPDLPPPAGLQRHFLCLEPHRSHPFRGFLHR